MGFADALSHAGVKWLAASPETMISPGVPTGVADAIAKNGGDPLAMGNAVVNAVMHQKYGAGGMSWGPAAAFDVLDVDRAKMQKVETSVKALNDAIAAKKATPPLESRFATTASVRRVWCDFRKPQAICRGTRTGPRSNCMERLPPMAVWTIARAQRQRRPKIR